MMYSECYTFYKEPGQNQGRFFHDSYTDDGGVWKGSGTYTENQLSINLTYADWTEPVISYAVSETSSEEVKVYWTDTWGERQDWFHLKCVDSFGKRVFDTFSDGMEGYAVVPGKFNGAGYKFVLSGNSMHEVYRFRITEPADFVMLSVNDTTRLHTFSNPPKVLRKTSKGFTARALWAKGAPLFEVRKPEDAPPPPIPGADEFDDQICYRNRNFSAKELSKKYPFSEASKIKLVAFEADRHTIPSDGKGNVLEDKCKEVIELSSAGIDSLMDVLYNYNYHDSLNVKTITQEGCYEPRHGVIFYNNKGKPFAYLELCFTCWGYKTNIHKNSFGEWCDGKYELLENFVKQSGITFFAEQDESLEQIRKH